MNRTLDCITLIITFEFDTCVAELEVVGESVAVASLVTVTRWARAFPVCLRKCLT